MSNSASPNPANPFLPAAAPSSARRNHLVVSAVVVLLGVGAIVLLVMAATGGSAMPPAQAMQVGGAGASAIDDATADVSDAGADAAPEVSGGGAAETSLSLANAKLLVADAAEMAQQAEWEDAVGDLALITDANQRRMLGVDALAKTIATKQARWTTLDGQLQTQVRLERWPAALATLTQMRGIATLDQAHMETLETAKVLVAPKAPVTPKPKVKATPAKASGGGSSSTSTNNVDAGSAGNAAAGDTSKPAKVSAAEAAVAALGNINSAGTGEDEDGDESDPFADAG